MSPVLLTEKRSVCSKPHHDYGTPHTYLQNQFLYLSGRKQSGIIIIEQGLVRLGTYNEAGEETTLAVLKPGDVLGKLLAGRDEEFAQALTPVRVKTIDQRTFNYLLTTQPTFAQEFMNLLGARVRQVERHFRMLNNPRARTRIVSFLRFLAEQGGHRQDDGTIVIDNFLTHDELANITNTSRQTVSACLMQLEAEGSVRYTRKQISLIF